MSGCNIEADKKLELNYKLWVIWQGTYNMLFRRLLLSALVTAARHPKVQQKAGEAAGKAMNAARPTLLKASRRAGELTRKLSENIKQK